MEAMSLKLFNSYTRQREDFKSIEPGKVKMYVCGPTVYDLLHVGNFRGAIFFNLLRQWLAFIGYQVSFVYNFTDIDDKIIKRAQEEGVDALSLSARYIDEFKKDFLSLKLTPHTYNPKCSDHIPEMINFVKTLIDKGHAYEVNGEVFFSINSFKDYGKLSGKNIESLEAGHRVDPNPSKKAPLDFVLWKPSKEGEPQWDSPWGLGRPGWHLECSVMNHSLLGETIDIHGGGIDLTFPHHENEIAQSECCTGKPFARYWLHNNFINFGDAKMSKSLGNVVKARDFMKQYHPELLKFMILSVHYRSMLNMSSDQVMQAIAGISRIYAAIRLADDVLTHGRNEQIDDLFAKELQEADKRIEDALNDDLNTPATFAVIFDVVRSFNAGYKPGQKVKPIHVFKARSFKEWIAKYGQLMALFQEPADTFLHQLDQILIREKSIDTDVVEKLIEQRIEAREGKDFQRADEIRDQLSSMDIIVQDSARGTTWEVKKG